MEENMVKRETVKVDKLYKKFKLSRRQKKLTGDNRDFVVAVNNLSFSAYSGEIFGLLGANGAGKTTTLRILSTLIKPDGGDAQVLGDSVLLNPEKVRSNIAFLTSELKLEDFSRPIICSIFLPNCAAWTNKRATSAKRSFSTCSE